MELIKGEQGHFFVCNECKIEFDSVVQTNTLNRWICKKCIVKMCLIINPIQFDKGSIKNWVINKLIEDTESCAEEGMSNMMELDCDKFIKWLKPFLEENK